MNVAPKDLAMVVGAPRPWAGATCTVLRPVSMPGAMVQEWGPFWGVEFARPMPCRSFNSPNETHLSVECVMPDRLLRKIGGPDVDITEHFKAFDFGKERLPGALLVVTETQS